MPARAFTPYVDAEDLDWVALGAEEVPLEVEGLVAVVDAPVVVWLAPPVCAGVLVKVTPKASQML